MDSQEKTQEMGKAEELNRVATEANSAISSEAPVSETAPEAAETAQSVQPEAAAAQASEAPVEAETVAATVATEPVEAAADAPGDATTAESSQSEDVAAGQDPTEQTAADAPEGEATPEIKRNYNTKEEVLERTKELAHGEETPSKDEVDYLKTVFYKLSTAEREARMKAFVEAGGDPEAFQMTPDDTEVAFRAEMGIVRERRAKLFREQEAEKEANLKRKQEIIEKIKSMVTTPEEANKLFPEFKALQQEWKEIKSVPANKANELWRNYQLYVEQFYDMLKLNSEAREYDFKKNQEAKLRLCEAAEKLAEEEDVISAFHQLQKLHQEYRETGPVAKELREEIWARFKAASTVINKRHQQHFEQIRAKEDDNLKRKEALCERVEAIAAEENKGSADWERHTKAIIEVQTEWKTIGFAPQKMNVKIFERFRAACDDFFGRKAEYFKSLKDTLRTNADKKRALIEQANALKDSTDWKATSDKLIALQKEWRTIGMVPKKIGDQLWTEFLGACNHFFEARNAANAGQRGEEHANLKHKREIIEKLNALTPESGEGDLQAVVKQLIEEYAGVGHVPYREKDKLYEQYRAALNRLESELGVSVNRRRQGGQRGRDRASEQIESGSDNERARLLRQYEALRSEIQTYENNLGFLNASSKKGNSLIDEMTKKVQRQKDEMNKLRERIKAIDAQAAAQEGQENA